MNLMTHGPHAAIRDNFSAKISMGIYLTAYYSATINLEGIVMLWVNLGQVKR